MKTIIAPRGATIYTKLKEKVEVLFVEEKTNITFGQLLDLIDYTRTSIARKLRVVLAEDGCAVEGPTASGVWTPLEGRTVAEISVDHSTLLVWLREADA